MLTQVRLPHPESISSTEDVLSESLCCGGKRRVISDREDDGGCIARMVERCQTDPKSLHSGRDVHRMA
ncbi:hypothetical protein E2C01_029791 [Portunus trituberculatus]|uniref:Uncharacterized protein n=1 Tax=Portunus trituberculatus TaxID=210409 RepID=A0A5B7ET63_PORTR|nr:hypothetical protein [Portunus trituberculatus]